MTDSSGHMALWKCQAFHPPHVDHMYEVLLTYFPYRISIIPIDTFAYVNAKQMQPHNFIQVLIDPQTLSHYCWWLKSSKLFLFYTIDKLEQRAILSWIRLNFIFHLFHVISNEIPYSHKWYKYSLVCLETKSAQASEMHLYICIYLC